MSDQIRILLVDDHQIIRQGTRALFDQNPGFQVIGEASDGRTAVGMAQQLSPDVVIMDLQMPTLNGIDATRQIKASNPDVKIICLSAHSDRQMAEAALKAGAMGYVLKTAAFEQLTEAVQSVINAKVYLGPEITGHMVENLVNNPRNVGPGGATGLSMREREVVQLMAEGFSTKQIAAQLHISAKTVETHRRNLMEKLQIDSVAELTKYAIREGMTPL